MAEADDNLVTLVIDGRETAVPPGTTILEAARGLGIYIPVFCAHEKLKPVGMCRICLVEVAHSPKVVTACTTEVAPGMVVHTDSEKARQGRREQMEFLLINHPLDCPICDEGGECHLQDLAYEWGPGRSRYPPQWKRRFRKPVDLGPHILLDRERCIVCYRCVRFCEEIAGRRVLGMRERGDRSYIHSISDPPFDTQFSGNTVELCPVGALTAKQYRFVSRPWEYESTNSVCARCGLGCNVRLHHRGRRLKRLVTRENPEVDDGWLCDDGRLGSVDDANRPDRLKQCLARRRSGLEPVEWEEALDAAAESLAAYRDEPGTLVGVASAWATNEEVFAFRALIAGLGGKVVLWPPNDLLAAGLARRVSAGSIRDLDEARGVLLYGSDLSDELPVLELRLGKAVRQRGAQLTVVHPQLTGFDRYATRSFRGGPEHLLAALEGLPDGPVVLLIGRRAARGDQVPKLVDRLASFLEGRRDATALFLAREANAVGAWALGAEPGGIPAAGRAAYVLGADPHGDDGLAEALGEPAALVVQSPFASPTTEKADVVLPGTVAGEKDGTLTNTEGRIQRLRAAVRAPGAARDDLSIIAGLALRLGVAPVGECAADVFGAMPAAASAYSGLSLADLGDTGLQRPMSQASRTD